MTSKLQCGDRLGPYELLTQIGHGGAATVWAARYRGERTDVAQLVALKILRDSVSREPSFRERFLREAELLRGIVNPHVVRVYDAGAASGGELYTAMEWIYGESLHRIIVSANRRKPVPPELAARLVADIAEGLAAVHRATDVTGRPLGLVHCDISPQNVLVGADGRVMLVDFGVASTENQLRTPDKKLRGKPGYMSPEQTRGSQLDQRSDLFSLGIVLFELATGRRLFRGTDQSETLRLVRACWVPSPSELNASFPPRLEAIILRALEAQPADRFQSADAFREALNHYLREEGIIVPRAGLRSLVKRVVGSELESIQDRIRACLLALDG